MLSPGSGAGRMMSPVLARASDLAAASAAAAAQLRAADDGGASSCTALPAGWDMGAASEQGLPCRGPDQAAAATPLSSSFLSLSPTTQWLQAGCSLFRAAPFVAHTPVAWQAALPASTTRD